MDPCSGGDLRVDGGGDSRAHRVPLTLAGAMGHGVQCFSYFREDKLAVVLNTKQSAINLLVIWLAASCLLLINLIPSKSPFLLSPSLTR